VLVVKLLSAKVIRTEVTKTIAVAIVLIGSSGCKKADDTPVLCDPAGCQAVVKVGGQP
jgi:hypothetical protein